MPLERVNLARGTGDAPAGASSTDKFAATPEELRAIQEKMKDPVFVELMHDYMRSLEDPATRQEEEAYLEQAEREAREGGDFSFEFVFPRAAYVVELLEPSNARVTAAEAKGLGVAAASTPAADAQQAVRSFLNVCQSDKVKAFTEHTTGDRSGSNWEVPVSVSQRRVEVYNPVAAAPSAQIPAEYAASSAAASDASSSPSQLCIVHDVVFHPATLELAERSNRFMCFLTEIAVEHINSGYGETNGFRFRRLPSSVVSIGTPQNQTVRSRKDADPFAVDPRDPVLRQPTKHFPEKTITAPTTKKNAKDSSSKSEKERCESTPTAASAAAVSGPTTATAASTLDEAKLPPYTIAHRGSIDLTDAWRWSVSDKRIGVPEELIVKLTFADVRRAAALDITITSDGHAVRIDRTEGQPCYEGEVVLPFTVEEVPAEAQFDRARGVLTLTLRVVPPARPDGVPTAEELRRTLPGGGGAGGAAKEEKREREGDSGEPQQAVVSRAEATATASTIEEDKAAVEASRPVDPPPPSAASTNVPTAAPSPQDDAATMGKACEAPESKPASGPTPTSAPAASAASHSKPEVAHIGNQDRVAAMMAQVEAARAARVAAAAAEAAMEEAAAEEARATLRATDDAVTAGDTHYPKEAPRKDKAAADSARPPAPRATQEGVKERKEEEGDIPFIRKAAALSTAADVRTGGTAHVGDDIDAVRTRQQAWAAMMEAEMQAAKAREEADAAAAARAAEAQAAKIRRKLAAEKEEERLEQLTQAKRDALPLSNKYIFAVD
ncbi:hypothetical protein ABB37_06215 [Leptomonas pyrrhocoris]|uniref:PIH1D1/2/3 CS-like domain-containing protein n=1 Tax=Leptomonas pyrrhocoris TaxID=157538 RepID=A0A0M9FYC6_LEPPY|nr:hypothetical protein ABB37_06215 [Leptomonas pyrrhocoris]KPA78615.1 hypothetical protein ABB37_06215 [Leptomonas pyrrhocoris]|eukprot:XP_015657054.1 hypothetical protein ABB37_06215 [Leptomonas pyrrhocoris]